MELNKKWKTFGIKQILKGSHDGNTLDCWVCGLCQISRTLHKKKTTFWKLGLLPSSGESRETPALLDPFKRANFNYWTTHVKVKVTLRPTVIWPVHLGVRRPSGTCDQLFILLEMLFRQLRVCYFVAPSPTRGRVCLVSVISL
jgi:hypothetical protein